MAFSQPSKFDHDRDGKPGGSLPKGARMAKSDSISSGDGNDTLAAGAAETVSGSGAVDDLGLDPAEVGADDPVRTGVPRDETHDSIDPHTGTLTAEAVAARQGS